MTEIPIFRVIPYPSELSEDPVFRNEGVLRLSDDEIRIVTTWWNWTRHMALPLGLMNADLADVFSGRARTREVVLTMRRDRLESIVIRPDAKPWPHIQVVGVREEDGKSWLCDCTYREESVPLVERLKSYIQPDKVTLGKNGRT